MVQTQNRSRHSQKGYDMLLDLESLKEKYSMNIKGVIQVGAHFGEEWNKAIYFEPCKKAFSVLSSKYDNCHNVALGNFTGTATMFTETANSGQSNSLLKPKRHLKQYPKITFNGTEDVNVRKLDDIAFNRNEYNMLVMDVQGYEIEVLKGASETLNHIDYIISEINREELYEGCVMVWDLVSYLTDFRLVETNWAGDTWGDGLWVRK